MSRDDVPVLSKPVVLSSLPSTGQVYAIGAGESERARMAKAYDLSEVRAFSAELTVERTAEGAQVTGWVRAEIVQPCVVTLEPVVQAIDEPVDIAFSRHVSEADHEIRDDDPDAPDLPEPLEGDEVDVGALAEEFLVMAIDPYPRAEGAEIPAEYRGGEDEGDSPFAALSALRGGDDEPGAKD